MTEYEDLFEQVVNVMQSKKIPEKQAEFAKSLYDAYIEQGFTEEQALELLKSEKPIEVDAEL
jgi:hypothetical protein